MKVKDFPSEEVRARKLMVCCPICGAKLMKSSVANDEIRCIRCSTHVVVFLQDERMLITIDRRAHA